MAIKVTTPETKQEPKPFPKLMVINETGNNGTIVFFVRNNQGVVITGYGSWANKEGEYISSWAMSHFTDYNDPITIQNA